MNILDGKVLGVIGGMGPLATNIFYNMVIEKTDAKCDQDHINMIILSHATMPDRTEAIKSGNVEKIYTKLLKDARFLEESGAECIAIPCNTSHFLIDKVQKEIKIPIINMIKEAIDKVEENLKDKSDIKVGIMATDGTIEMGLYSKECKKRNIEVVVPNIENQKKVMKIIYEGIKEAKGVNDSEFYDVVDELKNKGCQCIVMACTELSVYKQQKKLDDYYIDAMEALCDKAIKLCGK